MDIKARALDVLNRIPEIRARLRPETCLTLFTIAETREAHEALLEEVGLVHDSRRHFVHKVDEELPSVIWTPLRMPLGNQSRGILGRTALLTLIDKNVELGLDDGEEIRMALLGLERSSTTVARILGLGARYLRVTIELPRKAGQTLLIGADCEIAEPTVQVRVVVCAANRYGDLIICSTRHHDEVMNAQILAAGCEGKGEQGFIDQWGKFMNSVEALEVAVEAGQINVRRPKHAGAWLCSEDLY